MGWTYGISGILVLQWKCSTCIYLPRHAFPRSFTQLMSFCDVRWCHYVMLWCHMTSWHHTTRQGFVFGHWNQNEWVNLLGNLIFQPGDLGSWLLTLNIELTRDIAQLHQHIKFHAHTHTKTGQLLLPQQVKLNVISYFAFVAGVSYNLTPAPRPAAGGYYIQWGHQCLSCGGWWFWPKSNGKRGPIIICLDTLKSLLEAHLQQRRPLTCRGIYQLSRSINRIKFGPFWAEILSKKWHHIREGAMSCLK